MRPEIKFHSNSKDCFKNEHQLVRAFVYTDYEIEAHNHDFYEVNIVLRGKGTHQIENACLKVRAGDVFVIPPMTVHAYYDTENLDVYHVLLHKRFILKNQKESVNVPGFLHLVEIEPFLRQHFSSAMFLHLSGSELLQLKAELSLIEDGSEFDDDTFIPLRHHAVWKILYQLSYLLFKQMNSEQNEKLNKYDYAIIQALEYIHQNYAEKITIDSLCKKAYLSRSTFLRSFYDMCGCTPIQYLNEYRCEKAKELIKNGGMSKTEIAHRCGFYDLSHMERMMKK